MVVNQGKPSRRRATLVVSVALAVGIVLAGTQANAASDVVAPDTATATVLPAFVGPGRAQTIAFVGHDDVTATAALTFECSFDGATFASCTSPVTSPAYGSGDHELRVRARDAAGNVDGSPATTTWSIDDAPPVVTIDGSPDRQIAISFHGHDDHTAAQDLRYECAFAQGSPTTPPGSIPPPTSYQACSSPWVPFVGAGGPYRMAIRAIDEAGNVTPTDGAASISFPARSSESVIVTSDVPPSTTATSATFALKATNFQIPATGTNDQVTGFRCALDGAPFAPCGNSVIINPGVGASATLTLDSLTEGPHTLAVKSDRGVLTDYYDWTVDTTLPTIALTTAPTGTTPADSGLLAFSAVDAAGRSKLVTTCSADGAAFAPCTSPLVLDHETPGSHTVSVRATDPAGNAGAAATAAWTVQGSTASTTTTTPTTTTVVVPWFIRLIRLLLCVFFGICT